MGACFDSVSFGACSREQLKQKFLDFQERSCHENGADTYAGHLGIVNGLTISPKIFKDASSAEDYVSENTQKWEPALAVQVGDFSQVFPKTAAEKKLMETFTEIQKTLNNWDADIVKRVKMGKSQQRTCPDCQSKVTVSYIKSNSCPVCNSKKFLQTDTDTKKFKTLQAKYKEVEAKVVAAKGKYAEANKKNFWYVGGWCAS